MRLRKDVPKADFKIWALKYSTKSVLLDARKVSLHNMIEFTKAPSWPGLYYVKGEDVFKAKRTTNGSIPVYEVPLEYLEPLELVERVHHKEYGDVA